MNQTVIELHTNIEQSSVNTIKTKILSQLENKQVEDFFISFKDFINDDIKQIKFLVDEIENFSILKSVRIVFINYSKELFRILKKCTFNTGIQLYKNIDVFNLFNHSDLLKEGTKVLVYDEDEQNSKKLYFDLCKYGFVIDRAQNLNEFLKSKQSDSYDVVVCETFLNKRIVKTNETVQKLTLSKKSIVNLPIFMNKAVETLVSFTGLEASKKSHTIQKFDTIISKDCIFALMPFKGDIDGFFTLVFPKKIAIIALEALLGEKIQETDNVTLKDGVGELCNIITGSVKTELDANDTKVVFSLPQTDTSFNRIVKYIGDHNGVWINMELSKEPFYMFITK